MERIELTARLREKTGKSAARKTRVHADLVPAVCYGKDSKPVHIEVSISHLKRAISTPHKVNTVINLQIASPKETVEKMVLLKDIQRDPIGSKIIHLDFIEVRNDRPVRVRIPVILVGRAKGVAEGGIMQQIIRELEMRCLPQEIPVAIEHDVTEMGIGDALHVKDLKIPENASLLVDKDMTVAVVVEVKEEGAGGPAVAAAMGGTTAPSAEGAAQSATAAATEGAASTTEDKSAQPEKKR